MAEATPTDGESMSRAFGAGGEAGTRSGTKDLTQLTAGFFAQAAGGRAIRRIHVLALWLDRDRIGSREADEMIRGVFDQYTTDRADRIIKTDARRDAAAVSDRVEIEPDRTLDAGAPAAIPITSPVRFIQVVVGRTTGLINSGIGTTGGHDRGGGCGAFELQRKGPRSPGDQFAATDTSEGGIGIMRMIVVEGNKGSSDLAGLRVDFDRYHRAIHTQGG